MELSLDILLDELAIFNAAVFKSTSTRTAFKQIRFFRHPDQASDSSCLYLVDPGLNENDFRHNCPTNLLIVGSKVPPFFAEHGETILQIPNQIDAVELFQYIADIFMSFQEWNRSMLLAIVSHQSIADFLEIAAQKLANPVALFDNSLTLIARAGEFKGSHKGTIWEKFEESEYSLLDFFTLKEQRTISTLSQTNKGKPYLYYPVTDAEHTYASSNIWIDDKLYGNIGLVDINSPFTDGQLSIIRQITQHLTFYYENNSDFMGIAENNTYFIKNLLDGVPVDENIILYQLRRLGWQAKDDYQVLNFVCPLPFSSPIESLNYIKRINQCYPKSFIVVHQENIVLIIRRQDYPMGNPAEKQQLEQLLEKNTMHCGASVCFDDFKQLKTYYLQSHFAVDYAVEHSSAIFQYYENCYKEHLVHLLQQQIDLHCLCHPKILSMWHSQDENQQELIRCLYHFLLNGGNLATTSKELHLHRNTLIYRINKISQLLETDLKSLSSEQLFYLIFSCMIVEYL